MAEPKNIVLTHRYGDVCMLLPLAKYWADAGHLIRWVVHGHFADIFEGVSYVTPEVWNGDCSDAGLADSMLRVKQNRWDGETLVPRNKENGARWKRCEHISADFWLNCNALELYHELPLVFDRRSHEREETLMAKHLPKGTDKPILAYNLVGHSFRFDAGPRLECVIRDMNTRAGNPYTLLNLQQHRAARVFDLLGLIEKADVVLTVDTLTAHLPHATGTPTVVIVPDNTHASPEPRYHWIERIWNAEAMNPTGLDVLQSCLFGGTSERRKAARGRLCRKPADMFDKSRARVEYWK